MAGKTIKLGDLEIAVVDPGNALPVYADVFTEMWVANGVVHIAFAGLIKDGDAVSEARIVSRLRLSLGTIVDLQTAFSDILKREMPSKETMN